MAKFKYRLQKVFELRERRKKEQEDRVVKAQNRVREVENMIQQKKNEIALQKQNMITLLQENKMIAAHTLMGVTDDYIQKLYKDLDDLFVQLQTAKDELAWEKQMLLKAHAELEALVKHKEKSLEEWKEEEKQKEMKQLDEVAGQRYFRAQQDRMLEDLEDSALIAENLLADEAAELEKAYSLTYEAEDD